LGILKAGGCYVPLEPAYPAGRLEMMARDSGAEVLVTSRELAGGLPGFKETVFLDEGTEEREENLSLEVPATGAAYIMFTSGSTGRPKGVAIPHRAIVRLVRGQDYLRLSAKETFFQFSPISFDASTLEIWGTLLNGGRVAVAPPGQLSLEQIADSIRYTAADTALLTTGLFNLLADEHMEAFGLLRQVLTGGDVLSVPHARKVLAAHPHLRLVNGYGPTENATLVCAHTVTAADLELPSVPIGKPLANTSVRILDQEGSPVPIGMDGELYVGGDGLALGYWNQPEVTAEKFVELDGQTFYRTGDRVRWLPSGVIQFLGRQDQQVKIRGYRIELGEIEAAVSLQAGVLRCAVVALGDGPDKQLAAYYAGTAEPGALREALRPLLPAYMVPAFFTRLESLPLTDNGKVDRARLPSPLRSSTFALPPSPADVPRTDLEKTLAALWSEILSLPAPGMHANFFDIGGTSLKLVEAHSRLVRALRRPIPVTALFQYPTIASLAAFLTPKSPVPAPARISAAAERARNQREALARNQLSRKVP